MSRRIVDMRNLGPRMAIWLGEIGVKNDVDLRAMGSLAAWNRLRFIFGRQVSIVALYAMEASLRDCDWRKLPAEVKDALGKEATELPSRCANDQPDSGGLTNGHDLHFSGTLIRRR